LIEGWERRDDAAVGGLVIFRIAGHPWHVGLVVARDRFLHIPPGETSCVERLSSPMWAKRIEGFYVRR
jgi:cell wall-associated NlpC family hydrolase